VGLRQVDPLGQRAELDLILVQAVEELDRLEHRAAEPVHLPHHQRVALPKMG